jgi:hypothetical protein
MLTFISYVSPSPSSWNPNTTSHFIRKLFFKYYNLYLCLSSVPFLLDPEWKSV